MRIRAGLCSFRRALGRAASLLPELARDKRGNIAIMAALTMPVFVGALALGMEPGYWYLTSRNEQDAADAAVIAAAANNSDNYATEAKAVAAQYGFVDGEDNVTVAVSSDVTCPSGATDCYSVTITRDVPLFLTQVVGYRGDVTVGGTPMKEVQASAVSTASLAPTDYCLLALASSGAEGIRANGAPFADMTNCNIMSNTSATCNGHDLKATIGNAHESNSGCGETENSNVAAVDDPYSGLADYIPSNTCGGSYPQEPKKKKDAALPSSNKWSGTKDLSGNVIVCGDLQLTGNVTIDAPDDAVVVIENGQLDTNGYTLQSSSGSGLTVVFSGTNTSGYTHAPTGGGTLDFAAPTTGTWKGVAIYQDPNLSSGMDVSAAGNSPTWDITGLVYLPHASVTFSGAVNKASNGHSCFGMVVDNVTINGTGSILETGECAAAGLTLPSGTSPARGKLVR